MTDKPRYWTPEFLDLLVEELNRDSAFQRAARSFSGVVVMRCTDTPDGKDMAATYRIDNGRVRADLRVEDAPSRALRDEPFDKRAALARTTAPYAVWTRLDRGELNVLQLVTSPQYKLEGSKLKILSNIGMFNAMNAAAARIPKAY